MDILAAGEALFAEHGYDAVSMQKVAQASNTSKSNLYHHFKSKDDLYLSVLNHACKEVHDLTHELNHTDMNIADCLTTFSKGHLQHINKKNQMTKLILRELLDGGSERGRELSQQVFQEQFTQMRQLLVSGQASGEIRQDIDAAHMALAIVGLNVFLFQSWPILQHLPDAAFQDQYTSGETMFELLLHGMSSLNPNTSQETVPQEHSQGEHP